MRYIEPLQSILPQALVRRCAGDARRADALAMPAVDRLWGPDAPPFDPEKGRAYIRAIAVTESLDLPVADMGKVCLGNAQQMFGLEVG